MREQKRISLLSLLLLGLTGFGAAAAQDGPAVAAYAFTCDPDSFAYIAEHWWEDRYLSATFTYEDQTWENVRLRIRGDGSRGHPKKSLKFEFDGEPFADGRRTLNFNGEYLDKSYVHAVVSSWLMRASGQPAFEAEHARLYRNGDFLGLFVRIENIDDDFLEARGLDPAGNLYKASRDNASLSRFDDVYSLWEKKTNEDGDWNDLRALIANLDTVPDAAYPAFARETFEYDPMVNILAMNMLLSNGSTYYHNYYLYHDVNGSGKWTMMPWDMDLTLSAYGVNYYYHRSSSLVNPDNPFLERALLSEPVFEDIRRRIDVLAETLFNPDVLFPLIDSLTAVLEPSVAEDATDDIPDVAAWRAQLDQEKNYIAGRVAVLRQQFATFPAPFRVVRRAEVRPNGITFRWHPSADPGGAAVSYTLRYTTTVDYADDATTVVPGLADTVFTLTDLPPPGRYYWHVEAVNGHGVIQGFDTRNVFILGTSAPLPVVMNEINYNSADDLNVDDWVELFNPHTRRVDLSGWTLLDGEDNHVFTFPSGTFIPARGFLVLCEDSAAFRSFFPDVAPLAGNFNFGFSGGGERLRLYNLYDELVDEVAYDDAPPWPQEADGKGFTLELTDADQDNSAAERWAASLQRGGTPGRRNSRATGTEGEEVPAAFGLDQNYPNPFNPATRISFRMARDGHAALRVYDATGRLVETLVDGFRPAGTYVRAWQPEGLGGGVYFYVLQVDGHTVQTRSAVLIK